MSKGWPPRRVCGLFDPRFDHLHLYFDRPKGQNYLSVTTWSAYCLVLRSIMSSFRRVLFVISTEATREIGRSRE
ncbi:uncharacterized protein A1O5_01344 [Cladophialophora psammophila CBS 110553]|uniref:Uncharacterized protein n=1 Tax=Cladophialophora psammophila CBS 110553 TaxID=1182543 RepID=W9XCI5_9EURO|nr:uncharacterized protein A1O5_01344 [Cladophialophora psammophila CBS 110553]EXJ74651.1 hypothetical protein A1O5_01344 [Cladophialophora psammophila CBS 110553]